MKEINIVLHTTRTSQGIVLDNIVGFTVELLRKIYGLPVTYSVHYDDIDTSYLIIDNMPPLYLYELPEIDTLINIVRAVYDIYSIESIHNEKLVPSEI